jgi:hypothetical protein
MDEVSQWWAAVVGVAAYWLLGNEAEAENLYPAVESMPSAVKSHEDPLPKAALFAFRARRLFAASMKPPSIGAFEVKGDHASREHPVMGKEQESVFGRRSQLDADVLRLCNKAGQYLRHSLSMNSHHGDDYILQVNS